MFVFIFFVKFDSIVLMHVNVLQFCSISNATFHYIPSLSKINPKSFLSTS